jgi:hypothetical protein
MMTPLSTMEKEKNCPDSICILDGHVVGYSSSSDPHTCQYSLLHFAYITYAGMLAWPLGFKVFKLDT